MSFNIDEDKLEGLYERVCDALADLNDMDEDSWGEAKRCAESHLFSAKATLLAIGGALLALAPCGGAEDDKEPVDELSGGSNEETSVVPVDEGQQAPPW